MNPRNIPTLAVAFLAFSLFANATSGQEPPQPQRGAPPQASDQRPPTPGDVQALFDAMVIVQAQKALNLSDVQYPQFVGRLKALQDTRRRNQRERNQLIQQMQQRTNPANAAADEAQLKSLLKSFDDVQAKAAAEVRKAYEGVDQVLDVRQQVRFRVFEEQMERRKFEFLLNARRRARMTQPGTGD